MTHLAKQSGIILVAQALNQWSNQDGIPCCLIVDTLCCAQQLNDVGSTLQPREHIALHAQYLSQNMHALAAKLHEDSCQDFMKKLLASQQAHVMAACKLR